LAAAILRGAVALAVLSAMLISARPAQAQTEQVLYNFTGTPDGQGPTSRLTFNGANLYGTTFSGGAYGNGSVFELAPNGSGGWTESILYSFCPASPSCTDGANPQLSYVTFDTAGNIYGTTTNGGASGNGVVFKLTPSGQTWTESVAYSFSGEPDAANPINGLIFDSTGNLYGVAFSGGTGNNGAVFELSPAGANWTEKVIANLSTTDAGLTMTSSGYIVGATTSTVFALIPNGSGGWNSDAIFTFNPADAATEGSEPNGTPWVDSAQNVYGTTTAGGKNKGGVVFKLTPVKGVYKESLLFSFGDTGAAPIAGVVLDSSGNIYGTTSAGGKNGAGIVYELKAPEGGKGYIERTIQTFVGENGAVPYGALILDSNDYLYGSTYGGGADGNGAVFIANPHASVTKTTCTSSQNPSTQGQPVTFTATVTPAPPNGEPIVFEPVGQSNMVNGVATWTVSDLPVGKTTITAVYSGDLNFVGSHSVSFAQVVDK
jgi:uncharacterized repeat protein (TIGR03803 family)